LNKLITLRYRNSTTKKKPPRFEASQSKKKKIQNIQHRSICQSLIKKPFVPEKEKSSIETSVNYNHLSLKENRSFRKKKTHIKVSVKHLFICVLDKKPFVPEKKKKKASIEISVNHLSVLLITKTLVPEKRKPTPNHLSNIYLFSRKKNRSSRKKEGIIKCVFQHWLHLCPFRICYLLNLEFWPPRMT